jgi:TolB-like protein
MFPFSVGAVASPQQTGAVPLTQGIADLASQLAKSIPEGHSMTIAVTDFPQKKQVCGLGQFVAERLSTLLSRQPQCRLIERHRLEQVLQELKFSMSELVDPAKARKLGQMLGVQGLVVGTITDLGATVDADARIIDIQTDVSMPGASASMVKDDAVRQLLGDCGTSTGVVNPSLLPGGQGRNPPPVGGEQLVSPRSVVKEGVRFDLRRCWRSEKKVFCDFTITATKDDISLLFGGSGTIFDESGNSYRVAWVTLGNRDDSGGPLSGPRVINDLNAGVPTNGRLGFAQVPTEVETLSGIDMDCEVKGLRFKVQFRNIPVGK